MKLGYIFLIMAALLSGAKEQDESVLFIGQPCGCMNHISADQYLVSNELFDALASKDYRWVVVCEPVEHRQLLAGYLLRTQPQADIILMADEELAAKYRINYAPDCCSVLKMLKKDRKLSWKNSD